jgi:hypothetical protein
MAITQGLCTSFKVDLLTGAQNFTSGTGNTYKMALYTSSATINSTTTVYSTTNEISGTGYIAGGNTLTVSVSPTSSGTTAYLSFSDTSWTSATFTCRGALLYNSSNSNKAVAVFDFGSDKQVVGGTFTITFPTADATNAVIRIA